MRNTTTPSDAELLRLMVAGDDRAFTTLYQRHQGALYRFALLMSGSAAVAEDVTQEAFLTLIREAQSYDPARGTLSAYLYGVARHRVLRYLERERAHVPLLEEAEDGEAVPLITLLAQDDPFVDCMRQEMSKLVRQAVLALPPRYREVIVLCDLQDLSYAERPRRWAAQSEQLAHACAAGARCCLNGCGRRTSLTRPPLTLSRCGVLY